MAFLEIVGICFGAIVVINFIVAYFAFKKAILEPNDNNNQVNF